MIQVGDFVKIKSVKQLSKEYLQDSDGSFLCPGYFHNFMRKFCGLIGKVADLEEIGCGANGFTKIIFTHHNPILVTRAWFFTTAMVTKIKPPADLEELWRE